MKRMHDDKELFDLLKEEGFLDEVKVENIDSDNATQGEVLMADGSGGAEWSEIEAGMENPMTAADDLIIGGADGAPARLAKGSNGQVLQVGSSGLEWANVSGGDSWLEVDFQGSTGTEVQLTAQQVTDLLDKKYRGIKALNCHIAAGYAGSVDYFDSLWISNSSGDPFYYLAASRTFKRGATFAAETSTWYGNSQKLDFIFLYIHKTTYKCMQYTLSLTIPRVLTQSNFDALYCQKNAPDTDGTYVLKCTVVSGVKTYTWVSE